MANNIVYSIITYTYCTASLVMTLAVIYAFVFLVL